MALRIGGSPPPSTEKTGALSLNGADLPILAGNLTVSPVCEAGIWWAVLCGQPDGPLRRDRTAQGVVEREMGQLGRE